MADFDALYPGRFLKGRVLDRPRVIRIVSVVGTALEGEKGVKATGVLKYRGGFSIRDGKLVDDPKGEGEIVWCKSNAALTAAALGERDYEKWGGHLITIWFDPEVDMGGKAVGGIRVFGSPEMTQTKRVEISRPRRKKPDIYILRPTDKAGRPLDSKSEPTRQQPEQQFDAGEPVPPPEEDWGREVGADG